MPLTFYQIRHLTLTEGFLFPAIILMIWTNGSKTLEWYPQIIYQSITLKPYWWIEKILYHEFDRRSKGLLQHSNFKAPCSIDLYGTNRIVALVSQWSLLWFSLKNMNLDHKCDRVVASHGCCWRTSGTHRRIPGISSNVSFLGVPHRSPIFFVYAENAILFWKFTDVSIIQILCGNFKWLCIQSCYILQVGT